MLQPIQSPQISGYPATQISGYSGREKVEEEFLAIFYKELLKQVFKPFEEEKGNFTKTFGREMLVEKLALELAKNQSFSLPYYGLGGK